MIRKTVCPFLNSDNLLMKSEISFILEVSKLNNILSVCLRWMYWADEMVPKRENGKAANSRLTPYMYNVGFIISIVIIISRNAHSACPCRCNTQVQNVWFIDMYER